MRDLLVSMESGERRKPQRQTNFGEFSNKSRRPFLTTLFYTAGASISPKWWKPTPPMVHLGDHGMVHALCLSQAGVSGREEMIKAPIIIEGAKF